MSKCADVTVTGSCDVEKLANIYNKVNGKHRLEQFPSYSPAYLSYRKHSPTDTVKNLDALLVEPKGGKGMPTIKGQDSSAKHAA